MSARIAEVSMTDFDPTVGRFTAQHRRPDTWSDVVPASLSPRMRALLVIDGTVTKILEAYFLEPVDVRRIEQSVTELAETDDWLEAPASSRVIDRAVLLVGRDSQRVYTFAQSKIVLDRLSGRMEERLGDENFGIGRILLDSAAEMRRECLWYGAERPAELPESMAEHRSTTLVSRTYRVIQSGRPLMMITERFPADIAHAAAGQ